MISQDANIKNPNAKTYCVSHTVFATGEAPGWLTIEYKKAMTLKAARGAGTGNQGRTHSLCHLFLEAKTEGEATDKPWWQSGVIERRDYAREEIEQPTTKNCVTCGVLVGMHASALVARQAGERGE